MTDLPEPEWQAIVEQARREKEGGSLLRRILQEAQRRLTLALSSQN